jgi:F-type H+-transporting ATPase subunit epsilon
MAKGEELRCSVISPERVVLDCEASFVVFPAHDGQMGILEKRAPLACRLGIGPLRVETPTEGTRVLYINGGFAQVVNNQVTILTEQAKSPEDIDRAAAEQALTDARAMKITDDASFEARQNAIKRAQVQIKMAT